MKSAKIKSASVSFQSKKPSSQVIISGRDSECGVAPTPKDFDRFIPWLCLNLGAPRIVTVQRFDQEEYRPQSKRMSKARGKILKENSSKREILSYGIQAKSASNCVPLSLTVNTDEKYAIPMHTYYDPEGLLVKVAFINCSGEIPRRIIRAISTCLAFHPAFYRLTIKGGGLVQSVLDEIGKLLPYSNITDICLDSNHVVEGNYSVILDNVSCLQNLSLRRCEIDDKICKEMANKLEYGAPASISLVSLDLTSNIISDVGAEALGNMLRRNRMLLHLCLADNRLTDKGAFHIFNSIHSFPLSEDDIRDLKLRYLKYCFRKVKIYQQCEKETANLLKQESDKENRPHKSAKKTKNRRDAGASDFDKLTLMEQTEIMAKEFINDFTDVFDNQNIIMRQGRMYSIGNFKICYLNLAYNNLSYFSVKKLYEILKYQKTVNKPAECKGLLKVVLHGNNIPKVCKEMAHIESYLDTAVSESISSELKEGKSITKFPKKQSLLFK